MDTTGNRYVLEIPGCGPIEIEGFEEMNPGERKLAVCYAIAQRLGATAGLDMMAMYHMELCQNAPPHLAALAETGWPAARRGFVAECAARGFVLNDEDRATVARLAS